MAEESPSAPQVSLEEFLLGHSLYAAVTLPEDNQRIVERLRTGNLQFDSYCTGCESHSIFKTARPSSTIESLRYTVDSSNRTEKSNRIVLEMFCQRAWQHKFTFIVELIDGKLVKIGQWPSLEDISGADIERFRGVLSKEDFRELRRAGGLASHGVGIGSFVYLRRIIERLLSSHFELAALQDVSREEFDKKRVVEKIELLKAFLPEALVQNKVAYGILSKGIHELDEATCLAFFPALRAAIVFILEEDLRRKERGDRETEIRRALNEIASETAPKTRKPQSG